jgi:Asp-tRNA(Asn)/Glu-tRNA(Gln) amidotransferase C subunit
MEKRRVTKMAKKFWLSRETFLEIAEAAGLDTGDPHMEELYAYLQNVLPGLKRIEELDLTGMEPIVPSTSTKGACL